MWHVYLRYSSYRQGNSSTLYPKPCATYLSCLGYCRGPKNLPTLWSRIPTIDRSYGLIYLKYASKCYRQFSNSAYTSYSTVGALCPDDAPGMPGGIVKSRLSKLNRPPASRTSLDLLVGRGGVLRTARESWSTPLPRGLHRGYIYRIVVRGLPYFIGGVVTIAHVALGNKTLGQKTCNAFAG